MFGKRTISKMNPGDFVITVALGSMVAALILFRDIPVANGFAAMCAMVAVQFVVEWATARSTRLRNVIDGTPTLLVHNGKMLTRNMRRENIDEQDILDVLRRHAVGSVADARAVVLEIDGSFSVITKDVGREESTLRDVPRSA